MKNIQVVIKGEGTFSLKKGESVLSVLNKDKQAAVSGCGGNGSCGKCAVRFMMGAPLPTSTDRRFFSPSALREGYRLACLAKPQQNCIVDFCFSENDLDIVADSSLRSDAAQAAEETVSQASVVTSAGATVGGQMDSLVMVRVNPSDFGDTMVIVDLGTTTIVMQLVEIETGRIIDTYKTLNPQRRFGADVVSRMTHALKGDEVLLAECVQYTLDGEINKWLYQGFTPELIVVSGNTCMTYFYNSINVEELSKAPFTATHLDPIETDIAHIRTVFLPGLSAFVGGDITAGLMMVKKREEELAEELEEKAAAKKTAKAASSKGRKKAPALSRQRTVLFVDLGTNGEIALMRGEQIWATATSAGPAFEGGANANTPGTDMIRIIATLLERGMIDETGLFGEEYFNTGVTVDGVLIRQEDVRSIQVAKAAIYAGIRVLLSQAGIREDEIDQVYLAGGFGYFLDVESACRIGLLPGRWQDKTVAVGNTSLAGSLEYGLAYRKNPFSDPAAAIRSQVSSVNLAQVYEFEKLYVDAMNLATV
ncbi:MAG: DUF4445 domain-containing protein [Lachnospiraceae bacterium]|nr:DUF4445 domain-containing protein [Lachnospiraceae bacterium]